MITKPTAFTYCCMAIMARSGGFPCAILAAALLLIATQHAEAVTCSGVASALAPCVNYVRGIGPLQAGCCNGVKTLSSAAMTGPARQATCNCLKSFAAKIPGIKYGLAAGVPAMCNVNVGYAISPSTDCSKVH